MPSILQGVTIQGDGPKFGFVTADNKALQPGWRAGAGWIQSGGHLGQPLLSRFRAPTSAKRLD